MPAQPIDDRPAAPNRRTHTRLALAAAILGLILWYFVVLWARPALVVDETHHAVVARDLARGDWESSRRLPMPPTFHLLASLPVRLLGGELWVLRAFNLLISIALVWVFHSAAKAYRADYGPHDLLRLCAHPLLLPFWVLVYTDIALLLAILVALNLHVRRRVWPTVAALVAACLVRQSNVIWVAFFAVWTVIQQTRASLRSRLPASWLGRSSLWGSLRAAGPFGLALVAAAAAFLWRGGTTPGAQTINRAGVSLAQVYILPLCAALFWLPVWLTQFRRFWTKVCLPALLRPRTCATVVAALAILTVGYRCGPNWNADLDFVRHWPLHVMGRSLLARVAIASVILAFAATTTWVLWRRSERTILTLAWGFALLFVLPHFLADPRYYIVPFVLIDFLTPYTREEARRLTAWYVLLDVVVAAVFVFQPLNRPWLW